MKGKNITRVTLAHARRMKDKTDWNRVRRMTDEELVRAANSDPDAPILDDEAWKNAMSWPGFLAMRRGKKQVTLRLDVEVLDFFRKGGKGYQTKINQVLRSFIEAHNRPA